MGRRKSKYTGKTRDLWRVKATLSELEVIYMYIQPVYFSTEHKPGIGLHHIIETPVIFSINIMTGLTLYITFNLFIFIIDHIT